MFAQWSSNAFYIEQAWSNPLQWFNPSSFLFLLIQFRGTKKRAIFKKGYKKMHIKYPKGWLKLNAGQFGFYRVNYDSDNWQALVQQLKTDHTKLQASTDLTLYDVDKRNHFIRIYLWNLGKFRFIFVSLCAIFVQIPLVSN